MKFLLTISCFSLVILASFAEEQNFKVAGSVLCPLEGEYSFNPSDTDEMAIVYVKFRRPTEREGGEKDEWRADGTMHNSFHGTVVSFKGALVYKDGDDVVVSAQFFGFKLNKGDLKWLGNYERLLHLQKKEPAEQASADQPATASESKPEGKDKPQPESKPAPR
jgi:hypothetical protein